VRIWLPILLRNQGRRTTARPGTPTVGGSLEDSADGEAAPAVWTPHVKDSFTHLVVEPMIRDRIAIAKAGGEGKVEETAGIAIWASVSEAVDAKIREQIQARVFPVRLKAEDWNSGETTWLLDVIAPSQKAATAVLASFKQVVKDKPVRVHPLVSQLVDPAVLEKMKVRPVGEAGEKAESKEQV
jgi:hemolysin-activating ACP:hemolysin acyltransferase